MQNGTVSNGGVFVIKTRGLPFFFFFEDKKGRMYVLHPLVLTVCVINSKYMNVFFEVTQATQGLGSSF